MLLFVMLTFAVLCLPSKADAESPPRGLTIITHGYQGELLESFPAWVRDMDNAINVRMGSNVGIHTIRILASGPNGAILDPNNPHINLTSGAAIIAVDWTDANGGDFINCFRIVPTSVIGDRIFDYLEAHPDLLKIPIHYGSQRGDQSSHLSERLGKWRMV